MTQKYNNAFLALRKKSKVATAMLELACKYPRGENFGGYCTAVGLPCHSDWWYNHGPQQWASQQPGNRPPGTCNGDDACIFNTGILDLACGKCIKHASVLLFLRSLKLLNILLHHYPCQLYRPDSNAWLELFIGVDIAARLK